MFILRVNLNAFAIVTERTGSRKLPFDIFPPFFNREEVRAPIPQKQEILVEPEPLFGGKFNFFPWLYLTLLLSLGF